MKQVRKLAAIMFTDIQGYTALMQESEAKAMKVREKHRDAFNRLTEQHHGKIINYYGDGTLSIFESAVDAVRCGYQLQLHFLEEPIIPVRIGIHMGDIVITDEDIVGNSVNIASRIESLSIAGSVLFSEKVKEEISNQDDLQTIDLGNYHLKNDHKPRNVYGLNMPGLKVPEFGSLAGKIQILPDESTQQKYLLGWLDRIKGFRKSILAVFLLLLIGALSLWFFNRQVNQDQAREVVLPKIEELHDQKRYRDAFILAQKNEKHLKDDSGFQLLWNKISKSINVNSDPQGVTVYRKLYGAPEAQWELMGKTPMDNFRTYIGPSLWKFTKEGFHESIRLLESWSIGSINIEMWSLGTMPEGMALIEGRTSPLSILGVDYPGAVRVNSFLMDLYETNNAKYQEFVDAGGYKDSIYWEIPFVRNGDTMRFAEAQKLFLDKTNNPGPAGWELGEFLPGKENYPVRGISWYEAAAFAAYANKSLPTVFHWDRGAGNWLADLVIPNSNIQGNDVALVGKYRGITSNGIYDMAGNVREWCWNGSDWNQGRYILGGAWNDPTYGFNEGGAIDPFDRSLTNGFRCIKYLETNENQLELLQSFSSNPEKFKVGEPVSDEVFLLYKRQFIVDKTPFNEEIESVAVMAKDRTCQRITFDAAYGVERMSAYLFLPTNAKPPYQTVVYFPGSGATRANSFDPETDQEFPIVDFVLKRGRAVMFPIIKGTYDRKDGIINDFSNKSTNYRDNTVIWMKDMIRSVDYLQTRNDIDTTRLAYHGFSWGARLGSIILAIEPSFKVSVLVAGGISEHYPLEEVAEANYLPRVKIPVLMLNGRQDMCCFPVEASQKPFFELLGTDAKDKNHVIFENEAHIPTRADLARESIEWYNKYLGKVDLIN